VWDASRCRHFWSPPVSCDRRIRHDRASDQRLLRDFSQDRCQARRGPGAGRDALIAACADMRASAPKVFLGTGRTGQGRAATCSVHE
jgi:hypothetical protein